MASKKSIRTMLSGTLAVAMALPAFAAPNDPATPEQKAVLKQRADAANHPWSVWGREVINQENDYVKNSGFPSFFYYENQPVDLPTITREMSEIAEDTQDAVEKVKPGKTGTFWESATPMAYGKNGKHQWHELDLSGLADPDNIKSLLDKLKANGITDVRFGLDTFKVDPSKPETMEPVIRDIVVPMWERGMLPIVAFDWFGNLDMLEKRTKDGKVDLDFSFMNNPKYVEHREKLADMASKALFAAMDKFNADHSGKIAKGELPESRLMVNLINETHTNVAFNKNGWNGTGRNAAEVEKGFFTRNDWGGQSTSGISWRSPDLQRSYIPAAINLGRAGIRMRYAVEKNRGKHTVLFVHNEAMTPSYYPTHDKYLQFAVSRLFLGDEVFSDVNYDALMKEPLDKMIARLNALEADRERNGSTLNELEGMLKLYIFGAWNDTPEKREAARTMLVKMLQRYQRDVSKLKSDFKITQRHRLIFGADYYMQSEFISPKSVPALAGELAQNQGEGLKKVLGFKNESDFVEAVKDKARVAEQRTGVKFLNGNESRASQIDFDRLLTMEDAIMMDLLVGFRYANWERLNYPDLADRQKRAGLDKNLDAFEKASGDEYRTDEFLSDLLKDGEKKLRFVLDVKNDAELMQALDVAARDTRDRGPVLKISNGESIRDILNKDSRRILMRLFGLKNARFLGFLPPHYPVHIRAGIREGFLPIFMRYAKVMRVMHVAVKESGSPYYPWAENVHKQMALQAAMGAKRGGYIFVSYHFGPAVHTVGWSPSPLWGDLSTNNSVNESGFFKFEDKGNGKFEYSLVSWPGKQPWLKLFHDPLIKTLKAAEATQPKPRLVSVKAEIKMEPKADVIEAGKTAISKDVSSEKGRARARSCKALFTAI